MSLENSPAKATDAATQSGVLDSPKTDNVAYWHSLIDQKMAAEFLGMSCGFMEDRRQLGDGPKYISISARCVRYRRSDLRAWSEGLLKSSTSDAGMAAT